jgi:hypothetical protein
MTRTKAAPPPNDPAQLDLVRGADPTARARKGAPATSKAAAQSLTLGTMRASQMRVLQLFTEYGDMDDRSLLKVARAAGVKMSDSGLRSRRSELAKPNMDRLAALRHQWYKENNVVGGGVCLGLVSIDHMEREEANIPTAQYNAAVEWARRTLRLEGFRSPLWDTGRRVTYEGGREGTVWGKV